MRASVSSTAVALYCALGISWAGCFERLEIDSVTYACEPEKAEQHCGKGWECLPGPSGFNVCQRAGMGGDASALEAITDGDASGEASGPEVPAPDPIPEPPADTTGPPPELAPDAPAEVASDLPQDVLADQTGGPEPGPEPKPELGPEPKAELKPEPGPEPAPEPIPEPIEDASSETAAIETIEETDAPGPGTCGLTKMVCPDGFACISGVCDNGAGDVYVPAGPFYMGCNAVLEESKCTSVEKPQHGVQVAAFAIGKTEVTVGMYALCADQGECPPFVTGIDDCHGPADAPELPANCINWASAGAYCEFAGMRLCSEAEWEKAARGGCEFYGESGCQAATQIYPWGNADPTCQLTSIKLIEGTSCVGSLQPAGSLPDGASPYGALDMAGNVAEWVADWYHDNYNGAPTNGAPWIAGALNSNWRFARGGSWFHPTNDLRSAYRRAEDMTVQAPWFGFRCCYLVEP